MRDDCLLLPNKSPEPPTRGGPETLGPDERSRRKRRGQSAEVDFPAGPRIPSRVLYYSTARHGGKCGATRVSGILALMQGKKRALKKALPEAFEVRRAPPSHHRFTTRLLGGTRTASRVVRLKKGETGFNVELLGDN